MKELSTYNIALTLGTYNPVELVHLRIVDSLQ